MTEGLPLDEDVEPLLEPDVDPLLELPTLTVEPAELETLAQAVFEEDELPLEL
jgi:hypothetical protein